MRGTKAQFEGLKILKIPKKVDFCVFYMFLRKNAVPHLSPEWAFAYL